MASKMIITKKTRRIIPRILSTKLRVGSFGLVVVIGVEAEVTDVCVVFVGKGVVLAFVVDVNVVVVLGVDVIVVVGVEVVFVDDFVEVDIAFVVVIVVFCVVVEYTLAVVELELLVDFAVVFIRVEWVALVTLLDGLNDVAYLFDNVESFIRLANRLSVFKQLIAKQVIVTNRSKRIFTNIKKVFL